MAQPAVARTPEGRSGLAEGRPSHRLADRPEETLTDVVARYEGEGFRGQFASRAGGAVFCATCRKESDARDVGLWAMHRLEGVSDPEEEMAVAALECPRCGARGTLALAFGPMASKEDGVVLSRLPPPRGLDALRPGV
jgi:DNA-directed RNA polymerase subunit RPC12/RpoP